jgi:hypothetical protein
LRKVLEEKVLDSHIDLTLRELLGIATKATKATKATEDLYTACPNLKVTIGDVEIEQHFFVQDSTSHAIILCQPYITSSRMETKVSIVEQHSHELRVLTGEELFNSSW